MTEPQNPSPDRATGDSGVPGGRRDAGVPTGSSVPDELGVREPHGDPTTSQLSEMVGPPDEPADETVDDDSP